MIDLMPRLPFRAIRQKYKNSLKNQLSLAESGNRNCDSTKTTFRYIVFTLILSLPQAIIIGFANSINPDETAHIEPSHLDLRCLTFRRSTLHTNFFQEIVC